MNAHSADSLEGYSKLKAFHGVHVLSNKKVLVLVCSLALCHQFFQQTLLTQQFVALTTVQKQVFFICFVIATTAN